MDYPESFHENEAEETEGFPCFPAETTPDPIENRTASAQEDIIVSSAADSAEQKKPIWRRTVAAVLVISLLAGSCGIGLSAMKKNSDSAALSESTISQLNRRIGELEQQLKEVTARGDGAVVSSLAVSYEGAMSPREIFAENEKSVVGISCTKSAVSYNGMTSTGTSTGSGFILTEDGYVVTNHHVIENATSIKVVMSDKEEFEATLVGSDDFNDVAVLKIDAAGLPAVKLGRSDSLYVGDFVVAIGNPLTTLTATLTYGVVSGKDRKVTTDNTKINMIQTDAAINSGNSGGPLFNMYGEVVGITTAKYSGTTSSGASIESIGFAIPIDDVLKIISDLKDFGYVTGAYLGVNVQDTDASAATLYGLPTGAYVVSVVEGISADRAGVKAKDIIIGLGDYDVASVSELTKTLRLFNAGDVTTITVIRGGERKTMTITLDEKPKDLNSSAAEQPEQKEMPQNGTYDDWYKYFFGETPPQN